MNTNKVVDKILKSAKELRQNCQVKLDNGVILENCKYVRVPQEELMVGDQVSVLGLPSGTVIRIKSHQTASSSIYLDNGEILEKVAGDTVGVFRKTE